MPDKSEMVKRLEEMPDPEEWFSNEKGNKILEKTKEKQELEDKVKKMEEYIKELEKKKQEEENSKSGFVPVIRKRNLQKNQGLDSHSVKLPDDNDMPVFLKSIDQILTGMGVDYCKIPESLKKHVLNEDDTPAIVNKKCLIQTI